MSRDAVSLRVRRQRHDMAVFFHETENLMAKLGLLAPGSTRTRGRKPKEEKPSAIKNLRR
jgi:hypothetical protein